MLHRLIPFLCAPLMMTLTAQAQTGQQQQVYWYYSDFPPFYINSGPDQGKGLGDQLVQTFMRSMPQFHHERVLASLDRILEMMTTQTNACKVFLLKTPERAAVLEFSVPILKTLPNGFVTLRSRLEQFKPFLDQHGQLRFDDFLNDGRYRIGITAGRSFGAGIDAVLKKHEGQKSIVIHTSHGLASRLLKLVHQNEFDAVAAYPHELHSVVRQLQLNPHDFIFIPIAEHTSLLPICVACSKSAFGKQMITEINRVLENPTEQREIDNAYRFWLDEQSAERWNHLRTQARQN